MFNCKECCGEINHAPYCKEATRHKWHKEIKAWADGAEVEVYDEVNKFWEETKNPFWCENLDYRIKPKVVTYTIYINLYADGFDPFQFKSRETAESFGKANKSYIKTIKVTESLQGS